MRSRHNASSCRFSYLDGSPYRILGKQVHRHMNKHDHVRSIIVMIHVMLQKRMVRGVHWMKDLATSADAAGKENGLMLRSGNTVLGTVQP